MPPSPLSRREFLGTSLKVGVGAAALGWAGIGAEAGAAPTGHGSASPVVAPAPAPVQRFVSRPDLTPPGVSVAWTAGASRAGVPAHIFLSPHVVGPGQPASSSGLMIIDLSGNLVWWRQMTVPTAQAFNFRVQTYQGRAMLTWYQGQIVAPGYGRDGTCVISDDTYTPVQAVNAVGYGTDLHEFLITSEDTALVTAYQQDGAVLVGHAQEVEIGSNRRVWDWASLPTVPLSATYAAPGDYFHINSIDLWPGRDRDVLISSRNTSALYLVSRATKQIIWRLGGKSSSFAMGPGTRFEYQHDGRALADGSGVSLFDDASGGVPEKQSWGKVISLDARTRKATLRHEYRHTTASIDSGSQGNCQVLGTGGHFSGWGSEPYFSMYGPSGTAIQPPLLLDGRLPAGIQSYRAFMYNWTGRPDESDLALVVRNATAAGHFTAYTSWNGATQVGSYELSAGTSSLRTVTRVPCRSFETAIPFAAPGATDFQITALTSKGAVIGRSRIVGSTA